MRERMRATEDAVAKVGGGGGGGDFDGYAEDMLFAMAMVKAAGFTERFRLELQKRVLVSAVTTHKVLSQNLLILLMWVSS